MNAPVALVLDAVAFRAAVAEVVAEVVVEPRPALLDRGRFAREVSVSPATVDRLVREGLPFVRVGADRRFDLAECVAWLRARGAP